MMLVMTRLVTCVALCLFASMASAVELSLDSVTSQYNGREVALKVGGRATFDYDPVSRKLVASGTWTASYQYGRRDLDPRFTHELEDMRVSEDGDFSVRSYRCVEGSFAAMALGESTCGGYGFGPNFTDEGGGADDVRKGPPMSLARCVVTAFDWDGKSLRVTLEAEAPAGYSLALRFTVKPPLSG